MEGGAKVGHHLDHTIDKGMSVSIRRLVVAQLLKVLRGGVLVLTSMSLA